MPIGGNGRQRLKKRTMKEAERNGNALMESHVLEHSPRAARASEHLLIDQLPVGIFQKDREGRFTLVNSRFCRLKRAAAADYLGKTAQEVAAGRKAVNGSVQAESAREARLSSEGARHHEHIMRTGETIAGEEYYSNVDGKEQYLHAIKGPLRDADGAIVGTQGILLDITERKRTEEQLASERSLLRALLDSSTDSIYFKDLQSRFIRNSTAHIRLFNLAKPEDLIGKSDFDFQGAEHARKAFEDEQEIIRTGRPIIDKTEKEVWPDGRVTWSLTSKMPLTNDAGDVVGTLGISKNITAIKEAEAKVEALHKQLLATSRQAGMAEVATSVLHNVGNVLNSVNVSSSLLLDEAKNSRVSFLGKVVALLNEHNGDLGAYMAEDPKGRQLPGYLTLLCEELTSEQRRTVAELESIRQNIEHVKEIVAMQQNYAKVYGVTETVKVTELVEDALRMNAGALARHEVELIREYIDEPTVNIEKHKVLQILVNLVSNAKYACEAAGRKDKKLRIKVFQHDQWVSIEVIDNGIGIPPENQTRIFNHGFTTRKNGHGFGLHSGALAAKELGGTLTIQSEGTGKGATFIVELPLEPPKRDS